MGGSLTILVQAMFEGSTQNPKIMNILCEEWTKLGYNVIRFYPCYSRKKLLELKNQEGVHAFFFPQRKIYGAFLTELERNRHLLHKMVETIIKHPLCTIEFIMRRLPLVSNLYDESHRIKLETEKAVRKFSPNIVIAGSNPFFLSHGLAKINCSCKRIWFQMDPHFNSGMIGLNSVHRERNKELFIYEQMDKIFVQPSSYEIIKENLPKSIAEKVLPTRFPLINPNISVDENNEYFAPKTINCVYAGAIMLPIRRPDFMFKLFDSFSDKSIRLYIWSGNLTQELEREMKSILPATVSYCGSLPQDEMQKVLASADFLVNLGNTATNQLPSKLLDYISLRKPIINIYKTKKCPTLEVIEDYPMAISIYEGDDFEVSSILVEKFIKDYFGKKVSSQTIEENYREYLPRTVAKFVLENQSELQIDLEE